MTARRCADCGLEEVRTEDGKTNISPFGLCVGCHVKRALHQQACVKDFKVAAAGEGQED